MVLGADTQGQDVLSRELYGARISLTVGLVSQSVAVFLGVFLDRRLRRGSSVSPRRLRPGPRSLWPRHWESQEP
jgi:hypothetical protein